MNLGCFDFYPSLSGKGNAVRYLQSKWDVQPDECACLFDDDNDLPMAAHCGAAHLLPGLTSASVEIMASKHPGWRVASAAGQGPFATEECLEALLARAREEALLARVERALPLKVSRVRSREGREL